MNLVMKEGTDKCLLNHKCRIRALQESYQCRRGTEQSESSFRQSA